MQFQLSVLLLSSLTALLAAAAPTAYGTSSTLLFRRFEIRLPSGTWPNKTNHKEKLLQTR